MPSDPQMRPKPADPHLSAAKNRDLLHQSSLTVLQKLRIALALKKLTTDPAMKDRLHNLLSRKFLAALAGGILVTTLNHLGVSAEVTQQIVYLVSAYIIGQGTVDAVVAAKAKPALKKDV